MKPTVTAMIVVRNEEEYIAECMRSLLVQDYPCDEFEVLIVDGESTDATLKIAKETERLFSTRNDGRVTVRYLINYKRNLASGWNLGIQNAQGKYVTRLDAHGFAEQDFIKKSVETIEQIEEVGCVGGRAIAFAKTEKGKLISKIISSPFGVGNSKFRYAKKAGYVDTIGHGLYKKEVFEKVGYFNEQLIRNQDNDMHSRMRDYGYKFYYNPDIHSIYYNRETIRELLIQGYLNGKYGFEMITKGMNVMSLRHCIPFLFVVFNIISFGLGFCFKVVHLIQKIILLIYFFVGMIFSFMQTKNVVELFIMPMVFLGFHCSYGIGSLIGIMKGMNKNESI